MGSRFLSLSCPSVEHKDRRAGGSSMLTHLPNMCRALGLIPSNKKCMKHEDFITCILGHICTLCIQNAE